AKDKWVTRVVASNFDEGTVYVSQNGYRDDEFSPYLFRSTDYGKTWRSLAAGLPAEPINTVREDPRARHLLYVGTDSGVFVSLDRGATWNVLAGNLPRVAVHDVAVQPREGDLVVATHGRSVYVAEAAPLRKLKDGPPSAALAAFPVRKAKIGVRKGYGEHPYFTWPVEEPAVRIAYWEKASTPARIAIVDENGSVWKELEGTATAGMNVVTYDLSADPKFADAAEAKAREKALAKEKEKEKDKPAAAAKPATPPASGAAAPADEEEEDADEPPKPEERTPAAALKRPLDPELDRLLSDPMRASRKRYLAPGKYTVEIKAGGETQKTPLVVEAERGGFSFDAAVE
ncbi:MAG TPA: hypothetical protein VIZ69_09000, partial [Thermoanaerobaculia bacterium]